MEDWILAGELDGARAKPELTDDVCGVPHLLRLACDLASAGVSRVVVICNNGDVPDIAAIAQDLRVATRVSLNVADAPTRGAPSDRIVVVRSDRVFHRDLPKHAAAAHVRGTVTRIVGHDAVFVADRATATALAGSLRGPGAFARTVATYTTTWVHAPPYAITARVSGPKSLRDAERALVWSLRKPHDGLASKALNRRISLRLTWLLMRTRVHPDHVSIAALVLALAGGVVIALRHPIAGMLLVELGSIIDGTDGELARLRYQTSRRGQWLDTVVDDIANVAYVAGTIAFLDQLGVTWAAPLGSAALACFVLTQTTQYALIHFVYRSGDLAAIPWAYQSATSLARSGVRAAIPKLLERDFVLTVFVVFAIAGRMDFVLVGFSAGALTFFAVFFAQLVRHRHAWHARHLIV